MNSKTDADFAVFCQSNILQHFGPDELRDLFAISRELVLKKGDVLMREGDEGSQLFFLIQGTLKIEKSDKEISDAHVLEYLHPGEIIGELSFIDGSARSATVLAETDAVIRDISFQELERFANTSIKHSRIYAHLSKNISQKLRKTTESQVDQYKVRIRMGVFFIYLITFLCLFAYSISFLIELNKMVSNSSYVTLPLTLTIGAFLLAMMKHSKLSWREFGITLCKWKQAVLDGILLPIPLLGAGMAAQFIWSHFIAETPGSNLIKTFVSIGAPVAPMEFSDWVAAEVIYWFTIVPIQELCARGALQGMLERFLPSHHRTLTAILLSNLIFSTVHIYFSLSLALLVFFGGVYMGWVYSRTNNLISSWLAHCILGTWAFYNFMF